MFKFNYRQGRALSEHADLHILPLITISTTAKSKKTADAMLDAASRGEFNAWDKNYSKQLSAKIKSAGWVPGEAKRLDITVVLNARKSKPENQTQLIRLSALSQKSKTEAGINEWRRLGGDAAQTARNLRAKRVVVNLESAPNKFFPEILQAIYEGAILGTYSYDRYKRLNLANGSDASCPREIVLIGSERASAKTSAALKKAKIVAGAVCLARDLVTSPPSDLLPVDLVNVARQLRKRKPARLSLKIYNRRALKRIKANALLAVSRGSSSEPFMLHMTYKPFRRNRGKKRLVFVGKGITFDSGGLSIKSGKGMEEMKCDMAGAACVLSIAKALSEMDAKIAPQHEVHFIVPTCENMINGAAVKPGDIVFAANGKSIEILNTDAEGRLILADALSYTKQLDADVIIDLATLTGACVVALGNDYAGLFANKSQLQQALIQEGSRSGELLWSMPLAKEYRGMINSPIANLKNIGNGGPGAIIGAIFLQEFVPENVPWAHLDIAGPAFVSLNNEYIRQGGTGFGVRTLLRFLDSVEKLDLRA